MRVLELSLRNYRVFEEVDLEMPARVIGIFGENGAGKSTLMESIAFGCYGVDAARTKKHEIRTHGLLTECEVRVVFEHAGGQYEVRRAIKGRGHAPEAELFGGGLLLASGTTEVDAEVCRVLHMELPVFKASVYAEQGQLDAFSEVTPGKRKEMALRLLGIRPVDDARTTARRQAKATKESAAQLEGAVADLAALEADLKEAKEVAAESKKRARAAAVELKTATAAARSASEAFAEVDAARQRVEKLTVELRAKAGQRDEVAGQRDLLEERVAGLRAGLAELPELEARLVELGDVEERLRAAVRLVEAGAKLVAVQSQLEALAETDVAAADADLEVAEAALAAARSAAARTEAERAQLVTALAEAQERLARAAEADATQPCPTCGRPLGDDFAGYVRHCAEAVKVAKSQAGTAGRSARSAAGALAKAEKGRDVAALAGRRVREADAVRARLTEHAAALALEVGELGEPFGDEVPDVKVLGAQAAEAAGLSTRLAELGADRRHLEAAEGDLDAATRRLEAVASELAAFAEEAEGLAFDPGEHGRRATELRDRENALETARAAERDESDRSKDSEKRVGELTGALGQAKETSARVDELRSTARYVERVAMLLDGFRDHLVARVGPELSREAESLFRELTNHEYDDLRVDEETLSIQIADGDAYFPIGRFSGSETDLANLALRVAISTHLSRVSGADVGLLVLDEVLGSLDEERKDLMVQTLGRLSSRFHQLFVVTHAERMKDQFPASILVQKTGRRRSIAVLV